MALADDEAVELLMSEPQAVAAGSVILKAGQTDGQSFAYGTKGYLLPVKVKPQDVTVESEFEAVDHITIMKLGTAATGTKATDWNDGGAAIYWTEYAKYSVAIASDGTVTLSQVEDDGNSFVLDPENLPVGKYAVGAWVGGVAVKDVVTFSITGADATGLEFFDNSNGAKGAAGSKYDIEDEIVTFKNGFYTLNEGAGLGLKIGAEDVTGLFTINTSYVKGANGMKVHADHALKYAGAYYVQATGSGKYAGVVEWLPVTIAPINVADLAVTLGDVSSANAAANISPAIAAVNGVPGAGMLAVSGLPMSYAALGTYNATIGVNAAVFAPNPLASAAELAAEKAAFDASIYGTTTASFTVATKVGEGIDVYYGTEKLVNGATKKIDYSVAGTVDFAESAISVKYTALDSTVKTATDAEEVITYLKETATGFVPCEAADLKTPGTYKVSVTLKATADQAFEVGSYTYEITKGDLGSANISVTQDGKGVYGYAITDVYDGTDAMDAISIVLRDGKGAVIDDAYYTVEIKNTLDSKGNAVAADKQAVSEIVNAGTYAVEIKSDFYKMSDNVYTVTINPETVLAWPVDILELTGDKVGSALYTGDVIEPFAYFTSEKIVDGSPVQVEVPFEVAESDYKVTIKKFTPEGKTTPVAATEIKEAGVYEISVADVAGGNVNVTAGDYKLTVTAKDVFIDVPGDAWYAEELVKVVNEGIMGGYANSKFGPNDNAERQDLAVMIMRMLEPSTSLTVANGKDYTELVSLITGLVGELELPFSDTKGNAYYSLGVWYCNENGIMTGYSDSDEFGVGDDVTREQVAATLYRIEKGGYFGEEGTLFASVLDAYVDADEISNYAVEAMAWAVEQGIFGVNTAYLNPGEEITRAELAAVFARFLEMNEAAGKDLIA